MTNYTLPESLKTLKNALRLSTIKLSESLSSISDYYEKLYPKGLADQLNLISDNFSIFKNHTKIDMTNTLELIAIKLPESFNGTLDYHEKLYPKGLKDKLSLISDSFSILKNHIKIDMTNVSLETGIIQRHYEVNFNTRDIEHNRNYQIFWN